MKSQLINMPYFQVIKLWAVSFQGYLVSPVLHESFKASEGQFRVPHCKMRDEGCRIAGEQNYRCQVRRQKNQPYGSGLAGNVVT
jgi:hypothetical protein